MAVVAIVGILAALAVVGYQRYAQSAKTGEAKDLVNFIASAQHNYFQQTRGYLDCSSSYTDYYPAAPDSRKRHFHDPAHPDFQCWRLFNVDTDAATYSGFVTIAGVPGEAIQQPPTKQQISVTPPADLPWFIAYAAADLDNNSILEMIYTTSIMPGAVHVENQGE